MKTKVSILFYAKKAKAAANGLVPIYTRITINGKRIELSTNRFIEISKKEISLENLPKGFFLLTIIGQQKTFHQKIQHY